MKSYEHFDFLSPLSVSVALERLKKHQVNPGDYTFYGEVNGNHFNLNQDAGRARDPSDDPKVTGYILPILPRMVITKRRRKKRRKRKTAVWISGMG